MTRPKALLLDEPFGALDAKLRESMQIELRGLQKRLGVTTVFVTHDQQEALSMADRVAVMRAGLIEQYDAPITIYNNPLTPFVAEFIGETNRFMGKLIARSGGKAKVEIAGMSGPMPARDNPACAIGDGVVAMVRPERVQLAKRPTPASEVGLAGSVSDAVFTGDRLNVHVETAIGRVITAVANVGPEAAAMMQPGENVTLGWSWNDWLLFPGGWRHCHINAVKAKLRPNLAELKSLKSLNLRLAGTAVKGSNNR